MKYLLLLMVITPFFSGYSQDKIIVVKDNLEYDEVYTLSDGMFRVRKGGNYGFVNKAGVEVIAPVYPDAKDFSGEFAAAKSANTNKWGLIDKTGKWKVKPQYKRVGDKAFDLFYVFTDSITNMVGAADYNGSVLIPPNFSQINGTKKFIRTQKTKMSWGANTTIYGLYSSKGKELMPDEFDLVMVEDGSDIALVKKGNDFKIIDASGNIAVDTMGKYTLTNLCNNIIVLKNKETGLYGLADKRGKLLVDCRYNNVFQQTNVEGEQIYLVELKTKTWGKETTTYGLLDKSGNVILKPEYAYISAFAQGRAVARETSGALDGYINAKGVMVIPSKFTFAQSFTTGGTAKVTQMVNGVVENIVINTKGEKVGMQTENFSYLNDGFGVRKKKTEIVVIDKLKAQKIVENATDQWNISDGMFVIKDAKGKYGYCNMQGKNVIPCEYDAAGFFYNGMAYIGKTIGGKTLYGYITKDGKEILPGQLTSVTDFSDGYALVKEATGDKFFINTKGEKQELPATFTDLYGFKNGFAVAKSTENGAVKWTFIDKNFKQAYTTNSASLYFFSDGYALLNDADYTIIDQTFKTRGTFKKSEVDSIIMFSEGLLAFKEKSSKKWGYKNDKGETVIAPAYKTVTKFSEGLAGVMTEEGWGYINKSGTVVIKPRYSEAAPFNSGLAKVKVGALLGYIDKTGKEFVTPKYIRATDFEDGRAVIKIDNVYQLVKTAW